MVVPQPDQRQNNGPLLKSTEPAETGTAEEVWDEEELENSLKHLKEMHIQVSSDALRVCHAILMSV